MDIASGQYASDNAGFVPEIVSGVLADSENATTWGKWLGWVTSLVLLAAVTFALRGENFASMAHLIPRSPIFWLVFVASYLTVPVADWVIFRKLWGLEVSGFAPLLRKSVLNALVVSYAGEAYFYSWARSHLKRQHTPFGAIKDVAILSALVGNAVTLALALIAWPMLAKVKLGIGSAALVASIALLAAISVSSIAFRNKVFHLKGSELAFVGVVHFGRTILTVGLVALLWHLALPLVALHWWLLLSTGRMIVSRLPLIPNKDLAFAGITAFMFQHNLQIVGLMAMTAMLIFAAHLASAIGLAVGDFKKWNTDQ